MLSNIDCLSTVFGTSESDMAEAAEVGGEGQNGASSIELDSTNCAVAGELSGSIIFHILTEALGSWGI